MTDSPLYVRVAPFAVVALAALGTIPFGPMTDQWALIAGAILTVVIGLAVLALPWSRMPSWAKVVPALAYFVAVGLLQAGGGGMVGGFAPLAMLPILWLALYGTLRHLALGIIALALVFVLPILLAAGAEQPPATWRRAVLFVVVGATVGLTVQRLVGRIRSDSAHVAEQARLLSVLARTDPLTGLANRRVLEEHLAAEVGRSRRSGHPVSVAMLDLDQFKAFNDERGHAAGDALLAEAAAVWKRQLRGMDTLARYGGDEFALIAAESSLDEALSVADRLRALIPGGQTCSAGVAEWDGRESWQQLLARADAALYAAKSGGRDRVEPSVPSAQVAAPRPGAAVPVAGEESRPEAPAPVP